MALHDPDSSAAEKALKIGREKIQMEVVTAENSDDDMEDVGDGIPMQGEDGQHYVVLEVRSGKGDVICC